MPIYSKQIKRIMKCCKPDIRAALLLTGNEILSGDIIDTNSTFIAREFLPAGIKIDRKLVIGDDLQTIVDTLESLSKAFDVIVVNGGLGSTVDDLTAEAVSVLTNRRLVENEAAVENIKRRYGRAFSKDSEKYFKHLKKQAMLPEGVDIIPNPVGLAVGFKVQLNRGVFYFTPGVPREMKTMLKETILPDIVSSFPVNPALVTKKLKIIGTGESRIQQLIDQQFSEETWDQIELGFRASTATVEVKLSIRNESAFEALRLTENKIKDLFNDQVVSEGESIQEVIIRLLSKCNSTLSVLESSSAGQLCSLLNSVAEDTSMLKNSFFYNNPMELKDILELDECLMVPKQSFSIEQHEILAASYLAKTGTDYVLATSPIEPVEEETAESQGKKLIVTCGTSKNLISREYLIARDYEEFLVFTGIAALDLLRRHLRNFTYDIPYYFDELTRSRLK